MQQARRTSEQFRTLIPALPWLPENQKEVQSFWRSAASVEFGSALVQPACKGHRFCLGCGKEFMVRALFLGASRHGRRCGPREDRCAG